MKKVNFGVIVTTRSFFSAELAREERVNIVKKLEADGYGVIIPDEQATFAGSVSSYADAEVYSEYFKKNADNIDGFIIVLANFGEEVPVAETIRLTGLNVPILVQACDDDMSKMDLKHRRDAFCGKISVCNSLYQRNIKFTTTSRHTCKINSDIFTEDIVSFAGVCRVVKGIKTMRVGAIGARPDAFNTVRYSEKLLQASGITTVVTDLSEIIAAANAISDDCAEVNAKIAEIKAYGKIPEYIETHKVTKQAKLCLAVEKWIADNKCAASAIQCWNSIQHNYGCATCLVMSMMGQRGMPSACEMDVTGAVTMYAMQLAAGTPAGYLDWNNNYDDDDNMCVNLHCSNFPKSFFGHDDIEIENLDVLSTTIDPQKCFGACKGRVAGGEMTFAKITTDDKNGKIKVYIGEGEFVDHNVDTKGGVALCKIDRLQKLMQEICKNGFEHHVAMARGNIAGILEEAFGNYLGWDVYRHN